ncbi:MAG: extracellular solute-binding protein [Fimbriimonadaceae bacterium]|nr:extracellular solute-binding protein [Fimbriimonadaceae bacterium]
MKQLAWLIFALLLGLATSVSASERQPIIVWGLAPGPDSKGTDALVREFERRYPQYEVKLLSMGAGEMNPQKLLTSIVGGVPPDVIRQDRFSISDWASRGAFMPLDEFIARDRNEPNGVREEDYYDSTWQETIFDGKVYGVPMDADDRILYWNRRVFREKSDALRKAGLDPERPPRTWSEVLAYSEVLTEKNPDGTLKVAGYVPNYGNTWLYLYAFQMNASFLSEDGRTCTLYSPEAEEALQFMVDGYKLLGGYDNAKRFTDSFVGAENDPMINDRVAMKVDGDWILNTMSRYAPDLDFGVAPAPVPDDRYYRRGKFANEKDQFITWQGGFSYAIPTGAPNSEGAWQLIKFMSSTEGRMIEARAQAAWEVQRGREFIPRIKATRESNEQMFAEFRPKMPNYAAALQEHIRMSDYGRVRPPTMVGQLLWDEHVRAIEFACRGDKTPERALRDGQAVVQRELDSYYRFEKLPEADLRVPFALAGIALIGLTVAFWFRVRSMRLGRLARRETLWGFLLISPWILGFIVFTIGPMVASLVFSFTQYNVLSEARWVGLDNYQLLFGEEKDNVLKAFGNVMYLAGIGVPLGLITGLAIALILNTASRGIRTYRTIYYLPSIVPTIASSVLWAWILSPDSAKGLVNNLWTKTLAPWMGLTPPAWLTVADWSKPSLIIMGLWGAGGGMILWLAGLKGIPQSLYEAASIDGANPRRQFWNITMPMLSPILLFNTVMGVITVMQEFDRVYVFRGTSGSAGPSDSLLTPVLHLFVNAFNYFKMGYASALAWIVFAVILILTVLQLKLSKKWVYTESS